MAIKEDLIFQLQVDASKFAGELTKAVTTASKGLTPQLTIRAADIKFVGKIKINKILDLAGLAARLRDEVQAGLAQVNVGGGVGATASPTGRLDPRPRGVDIDPAAPIVKAVRAQNELTAAARANLSVQKAISNVLRLQRQPRKIDPAKRARVTPVSLRANLEFQNLDLNRQLKQAIGTIPRLQVVLSPQVEQIRKALSLLKLGIPVALKAVGVQALKAAISSIGVRGRAAIGAALDIGGGIVRTTAAFKGLGRVILGVGVAGKQLGNQMAASLTRAVTPIRAIGSAARRALRPLSRMLSSITRTTAILTGGGFIVGGAAFLPIVAVRAATGAFRQLGEFVDGVSQSVTLFSNKIAGLKGADKVAFLSSKFKELGDQVQNVGARFGLSTADVSKGLFGILSAQVGVTSVAERMEALNAASRIAVGGVTSLENAFKGTLALSRTFNQSLSAGADQLVAIQRLGIAPIDKLAGQLGRVASIAANAGAEASDLGAAISTITAQSVPLETAITGLRQFFGGIAKGGGSAVQKELASIQDRFNIKLDFDVNVLRRGGGLGPFLNQLQELRKLDPNTIGRLFPRVRVISALLPLLDNLNQFSRDRVQILGAEGEAQAAADARLQTISGSFSRLTTSISNTVVSVADQIASLVNLKGIVDRVIGTLNKFVSTVRDIPKLDLQEFVNGLLKTRSGLKAIIVAAGNAFGRVAFFAIKASGPILRVFTGLAAGISGLIIKGIAEGFVNGTRVAAVQLIKLAGVAERTGGIFGGVLEAGIVSLSAGLFVAADAGEKFSRSMGTASDLFEQGFDIGTLATDFDSLASRMASKFGDAGKQFGVEMLGSADSIEKRLSQLSARVTAGRITRDIGNVGKELARSISGLKVPQVGKGLVRDIQDQFAGSRALDISKSISGIEDLEKITDKDLSKKTIVSLQKLNEELKKAGIAAQAPDLRFPDQLEKDAGNIGIALQRSGQRLKQLRSDLGDIEFGIKPGTEKRLSREQLVEQERTINDRIRKETAAQAKLKNLFAKAQLDLKSLRRGEAVDVGLFKQLGIEESGRDVISQLTAVRKEAGRVLSGFGTEGFDKSKAGILSALEEFLALRVLQIDPKIQLSSKVTQDLRQSLGKVANNTQKNVSDLFSQVFTFEPTPLGPVIQLRRVISNTDRNRLARTIKSFRSQLQGITTGVGIRFGTESFLSQFFTKATSNLDSFLKLVSKIPGEVDKATDVGGSFDRITFFVADSEKALEAFAKSIGRSFKDAKDAAKELSRAAGEISSAVAKAGASAGVGIGSAVGGEAGVGSGVGVSIDNSHKTINVTPVEGSQGRFLVDPGSSSRSENRPPK